MAVHRQADHFHSSADRIAIAVRADQPHGQEVIAVRRIVAQQTQTGCGAIRAPNVHVAVLVPVDQRVGPPIVQEIQTADSRDRGKTEVMARVGAQIQEGTVSFVSTPRLPVLQHLIELCQIASIATAAIGHFGKCLRDPSVNATRPVAKRNFTSRPVICHR